jgi:hypothetical protein
MKIAMLGSGFIARFYADSLIGHRRLDVCMLCTAAMLQRLNNLLTIINSPCTATICTRW